MTRNKIKVIYSKAKLFFSINKRFLDSVCKIACLNRILIMYLENVLLSKILRPPSSLARGLTN